MKNPMQTTLFDQQQPTIPDSETSVPEMPDFGGDFEKEMDWLAGLSFEHWRSVIRKLKGGKHYV